MKRNISRRTAAAALLSAASPIPAAEGKLRVGLMGLAHGHAQGFLRTALTRPDLDLAGISEPDPQIVALYRQRFPQLDPARIHSSHAAMLDAVKPEAAMIFSSTVEHKELVDLCAARKIHAMMEKPLAVSLEHARAMAEAGRRAGIHVLVNYETTWYPVNAPIWRMVREEKRLGDIRRIVTHYGHQGPKEIGVGPEFLSWLTDPAKNGAGALFDFGCYGANFASWLFDNERPISVLAQVHVNKPAIYPKVDDEATLILQYPKAQVIVQPSWNWPFSRKDMEIYGTAGYLITSNPRGYRYRTGAMKVDEQLTAPALSSPHGDVVHYLTAVVRGRLQPAGLSAIDNNLVVTEILDAARRSARIGRLVRLPR
ncbi:MAG: Gfo/Idh/MocA family oxidoreductase [Bryobacterales bacterium]|nr:Gfo/Idh/MocA family oxidoreductase [Bryobacterales bacterium]